VAGLDPGEAGATLKPARSVVGDNGARPPSPACRGAARNEGEPARAERDNSPGDDPNQ
jgi:hypothetical protein